MKLIMAELRAITLHFLLSAGGILKIEILELAYELGFVCVTNLLFELICVFPVL